MLGALNLVGEGLKILEKFIPASDKEKEEFEQVRKTMSNQLNLARNQAITDRHKADMKSDSWLSKNIRPLTLIYLLAMFTLFSFGSLKFNISIEYVDMLKEMLMFAFAFYFGGRTLEKVISVAKDKPDFSDVDYTKLFKEESKNVK